MRSSGRSVTSPAAARTASGIGLASASETGSIETGSPPSSGPTPSSSLTAATAASGSSTRCSGSPQPHHFIPADRALALRPGRHGLETVERPVQRPADPPPHHRRTEPRQTPEPAVQRHRHLGVPVLRLQLDLRAGTPNEALERRALDGLLEDEAPAIALLDAAEVRADPPASAGPEHLRPAAVGRLALADVL